jgi:hypothetical protein
MIQEYRKYRTIYYKLENDQENGGKTSGAPNVKQNNEN